TQLAHARAQLALIPPLNEEETDLYATTRQALHTEIAEIEQTLTCKMQWVAIKKAVQFQGKGIELDDLIQIGMLGVIAGVKHFDITRKARLLIAVNMWTFQVLGRAVGDYGGVIRLPAHVFVQVELLKKQHLQWQRAHGRLPTRQGLAQAMDISLGSLAAILKAHELLKSAKHILSLEYLTRVEYMHEGYTFQTPEVDLMINDDVSMDIISDITGQQMLHQLFQHLTAREQLVFLQRAGLDGDGNGDSHTLEEIGQLLGVTRERVRQIEVRAKKKLRFQLKKMCPAPNASPKVDESAEPVSEEKSAHLPDKKAQTRGDEARREDTKVQEVR
ncbi:MAG: sigma-70 family RNA polymerase sigma factor, partial [Rhabdochlamydiaceae bacterium]